jgi:3-deoxy-D-manno-octulosonic-acid transferase
LIAYNLFLILYKFGIALVSPWNPKARLWLKGRKNIFDRVRSDLSKKRLSDVVWMHCASLGEFEQGRPVIEHIRRTAVNTCIIITFFSPSGYEVRKNYKGADFIFYLPPDSHRNARKFLDMVEPQLVIWVKYEYWYYYLTEIKKRNIPLLLVSGLFRKEQLFFKWYGTMHRRMLKCFTHLFVQTEDSRNLLASIGFSENVRVSGDTRFDRVIENAEQFQPVPLISEFCGAGPVIVAGSTWQEDEEVLDHFANSNPDVRFIIAPHEIDQPHLNVIKKLFRKAVFYSSLVQQQHTDGNGATNNNDAHVLIIDNIGMLSRLYKYATITYVGGAFGNDGVHNMLEAAVYGKPVVIGPVYEKFYEARDLVECGGAFSVENALELEEVLQVLLKSGHEYKKACEAAHGYVYTHNGATEMILKYIFENKMLTLAD